MSEPTQPNPVAVPWSPDAPVQNAPSPSLQASAPFPSPPYMGQLSPQPAQQPALPYGQPQMAQAPQPAFQAAPMQNPQGQNTYAQAAPGQYPPAQNVHSLPYMQAHTQAAPQSPTAHMRLNRAQPGTMPPPLAPHMQQAAPPILEVPTKSKNILQKLLRRSPKADQNGDPSYENRIAGLAPDHPGSPSRSFFNKNFVMGTVTGIIIGAFVLPMIINQFVSDSSRQTYAESQSISEGQTNALSGAQEFSDNNLNVPASSEGQTFLDAAIAADEP